MCTIHPAEGVLGYALTEVPMMHSQADTEDANCTVLKNQVLDRIVFLFYCCQHKRLASICLLYNTGSLMLYELE